MSAEEKILGGILLDAENSAKEITEKAEAEAKRLTDEAATNAKSYSAEVVSAALLKAKAIKQNAESAAELAVRDAKLAKKHQEIDKTISLAIEKIEQLPDDKYFSLLCGVAKKYAKDGEGVLFVGKKDIKRNLGIFEKMLKEKSINLKLSASPCDAELGFVMKYGDIEYNLSLSALIEDKRDVLEDRIHGILFA